MKKIRINTFETNSSSSHTLTIETISPLIENGTLYPGRLTYQNAGYEVSSIICSSIMTKLAYYMHFLKYNQSEENNHYILTLVQYFREQFSIDINFDFDYNFNGMSDDNGNQIFKFEESVNGMEYVKEAIELITDNSRIICDVYENN